MRTRQRDSTVDAAEVKAHGHQRHQEDQTQIKDDSAQSGSMDVVVKYSNHVDRKRWLIDNTKNFFSRAAWRLSDEGQVTQNLPTDRINRAQKTVRASRSQQQAPRSGDRQSSRRAKLTSLFVA